METYINQISKISLNNKYTKWYCNIIKNALSRETVLGYTEKHHIIPKSFKLGGEKDKNNIVRLTLCHNLLTKMFDGIKKQKMVFAFWRMVNSHGVCKTSKQYSLAKKLFIESQTNKHLPQDTKDKISKAHKGKKKNYDVWNKNKIGIQTHSTETKDKLRTFANCRSFEIDKKIKESAIKWTRRLKDKTHEEIYGNESSKIKKKIRKKLKGKTLEEILGPEKAAEGRRKRSEAMLKRYNKTRIKMKTEKIKLEIRAAEGGEDAKLLVNEMADIYKKAASINNFSYSVEH